MNFREKYKSFVVSSRKYSYPIYFFIRRMFSSLFEDQFPFFKWKSISFLFYGEKEERINKKNFYIKYFSRKYTLDIRNITKQELYLTNYTLRDLRLRLGCRIFIFSRFCKFRYRAVWIPNLFYNLYISSIDYTRTYDDTFAFLGYVYNCWERQNGCDGCYRSTVLPLLLWHSFAQLFGFSLPWISYQGVTIGSNTNATRNYEF